MCAPLANCKRSVCSPGSRSRVVVSLPLAEVDHGVGGEDDVARVDEVLVHEDVHVAGTLAYLAGRIHG